MSNTIDSDDMEEMGIPEKGSKKSKKALLLERTESEIFQELKNRAILGITDKQIAPFRVGISHIHKKVVLSPTEKEVLDEMDTFIVDKKKFEEKKEELE